jgi:hypothetical protein
MMNLSRRSLNSQNPLAYPDSIIHLVTEICAFFHNPLDLVSGSTAVALDHDVVRPYRNKYFGSWLQCPAPVNFQFVSTG